MPPICRVTRERYIPAPQSHVSAVMGTQYIGNGLRREERLANEGSSDWVDTIRIRSSDDNGRTWSDWDLVNPEWPTQGNCTKEQMPFCNCYDPISRRTVQMVFQRVVLGDPQQALAELWRGNRRYYDHGFWQVSADGGRSWSAVTDLRYDDGEQLHAPSSFARMIRSSKTRTLYWVGNISSTPPDGNSPRYPLYIAEVDETIPALKRESLTIIDDYDPNYDTPLLQLSNFSLLENRETQEFELYLTRYGERGDGKTYTGDFWTADVYKYLLSFS